MGGVQSNRNINMLRLGLAEIKHEAGFRLADSISLYKI